MWLGHGAVPEGRHLLEACRGFDQSQRLKRAACKKRASAFPSTSPSAFCFSRTLLLGRSPSRGFSTRSSLLRPFRTCQHPILCLFVSTLGRWVRLLARSVTPASRTFAPPCLLPSALLMHASSSRHFRFLVGERGIDLTRVAPGHDVPSRAFFPSSAPWLFTLPRLTHTHLYP